MSVITSKLTRDQERMICSMFGHAKLNLIYKASVHSYNNNNFHYKCNQQGPTLTVAYNNTGFIFGAYISKDYAQTGQNIVDEKAFLFSFDGREQNPEPYRVTSTGQYSFNDGDTGPNFGSLVFLLDNGADIQSNPGNFFNFDPLKMHGNDLVLTECEVYRVEECDALLAKPWRNVTWNAESKKGLMETIANWKSGINSVSQARILLVGQVGAGKSSFFNSVSSVFKGHVTSQANTGTAGTSLTTQFRTYSIRGGHSKKPLPIVLCDTMGLEEGLNAGLDIEDFTSILKGHVQDRYQFNPSMPLQEEAPGFRKSFTLKDKIHCVVYVIDTAKVKLLPARMIEKFAAFRRKTNQLGIPQLVLMTKVDEACPLVAEDLKTVYCSQNIEAMMREVAAQLGVSMSAVIPVKNYSQELELDLHTDILLLNSVIQMLRVAESYCDDLFLDEEEKAD
ncbi:interferon-induced protein 44-like [Alosa alosa]|uniref:interferon-induced protein 44-like n=1 Tax=Alosa alosa TaxID=278164 RepID=UPI00201520E6|nr:interferon-induced protein 44-like [Alosa alosa]